MKIQFTFQEEEKNTSKSSIENVAVEQDIFLVKVTHAEERKVVLQQTVDKGLIQFFFCAEGSARFHFGPAYSLGLESGKAMLLYNPDKDLAHHIELETAGKLLFLFVRVERLHKLFLKESEELYFLNNDNIHKKFYAQSELSTMLCLSLNQLFNIKLSSLSNLLYLKGKTYELLSLYFNREESDDNARNCPFLDDQTNVEKIRLSKKILIEKMSNPPGLKELAREIGLNEYQLKVGFKNIYGTTAFGFLSDYKMDHSRKLLDSGQYKVNEVAYALGYTNPSHFIAAFKKKFGVTPKKYLSSLKVA
jgi:AraC-like DNA-binding protein